jgi:hypothetical protein
VLIRPILANSSSSPGTETRLFVFNSWVSGLERPFLHQEHDNLRRLDLTCVPPNDMDIIRSSVEGLTGSQSHFLSAPQLRGTAGEPSHASMNVIRDTGPFIFRELNRLGMLFSSHQKRTSRLPFLNGGLFDCLDEELDESDSRAGRATIEGRGRKRVLRVDCFSENPARQPRLPNRVFFGGQAAADLSHYYGKPTRRSVKGLIDLFDSYKFTIEENTPWKKKPLSTQSCSARSSRTCLLPTTMTPKRRRGQVGQLLHPPRGC